MKKTTAKKEGITLVSKEKEAAYFKKVMKHKEAQEAYDEAEEFYHFVEQIKFAMKREHLTYYALAKRAGLRHQVLAWVLNGSKNAEYTTLSKVAHGVGAKLPLNLVFSGR